MEKKVVYDFCIGSGGIGDFIKFYCFLLSECIEKNIKLYILRRKIYLHKYIKLIDEKMYISQDELINPLTINNLSIVDSTRHYVIQPFSMYSKFDYNKIKFKISDIFYFSEEVLKRSKLFMQNEYISIHLRLGDKFLETDKRFVNCPNDTRVFNENNLHNFFQKNNSKNIIFFCDNNSYKKKLKQKYDYIITTNFEIGHTGLENASETQVLDAVSEFCILANSSRIYKASDSGFSVMASKFNNVSIESI